jgi:hypothetical protein
MSIGEPHAHMRESMESMFDFSSTSASARSSLCLFVNSRLIQMSCSSVYLPLCTPSSTANHRLDSVRFRNPLGFA